MSIDAKRPPNPLGVEPVSKLLLQFSIPAIVGMVIMALYNVVDRIFIGNSPDIGAIGIGAIALGMPIMTFMMALGMLIGIGGGALASIRLGEGNPKESEHILGNSATAIVLLTAAAAVLFLLFLDPLLRMFGASDEILPYSKDYLRIILAGSVFGSLTMAMNNFIRVDGRPKTAMLTMALGAGINIVLDPLFIFVFRWGIQGAALATILSQMASTVWVLHYFLGGESRLKLRRRNLPLAPPLVLKVMSIGLPSFLMQFANTFVIILINARLSLYGGDLAIAAMGIVTSMQMLMIMPILGINQGAQPLIGFNYGAGKLDRVKETLRLAIAAATIFSVVGFVIIQSMPGLLIRMFNDDPVLLVLGKDALRFFFLAMPVIGFQIIAASYFQAVGKTRTATFLSLSRQVIILIPAILLLSNLFGLYGVFYAPPLSDFLAALISAVFFHREMKHHLHAPYPSI
ncbi:MATE family efflux transporter [Anaerotalea alkaliphila]|uniref:Multidrug export protein MepA n=1 Tax=Anaerotalea alkaliphila TaxID=2662126 RepID=A0A7X5HTM0_9FIRM|nr:MATE family efflux transporter [Anaerotalea alkaliphila]NDL66447.1 MATE family efflux transporter [Anaerotalea alkaliphila]